MLAIGEPTFKYFNGISAPLKACNTTHKQTKTLGRSVKGIIAWHRLSLRSIDSSQATQHIIQPRQLTRQPKKCT